MAEIEAPMSKIISLDNKLKLSAKEKAAAARRRKIIAVRKVFHCTHCASKCERCGIGLGHENQTHVKNTRVPYHFCDSCAEEYIDYIDRLQGRGDSEAFWHNEAWMAVWQNWIEYQGSIDNYLRSKEFRRLLQELRADGENFEA
jgi:hypothetical protein